MFGLKAEVIRKKEGSMKSQNDIIFIAEHINLIFFIISIFLIYINNVVSCIYMRIA